jgi:hypothetical protein
LVDLLRAQLGTGEPPSTERLAQCDWARFERVAAHHGCTPILYKALRDQRADVLAAALRRMKLAYFGTALSNHLAGTFLDQIAAALGEHEIPVVVLKGAALLRTLYDDPAQRPLSDIDLLVDEQDVGRAGAQLQHIGLAPVASAHADQRGPLCHIHLVYRRPEARSIPVELHWRLFEPYQPYVFDLAEVRARAQHLAGMPDNVFVMSPEHQLAHLCVHLERHAAVFGSLVGRDDWFDLLLLPQGLGRLMWMYDIAKYLRQQAAVIDWDRFVGSARRWAIDGQLHAVFELCRRTFGVVPPLDVMRALDRGGPRLAERIAHRFVLASYRANEANEHAGGASRRPWVTQVTPHVLRLTHSWTTLFPPAAYLRASYPAPRSLARLWAQHARTVLPGLWAETRDRVRHTITTRRQRLHG